MSAVDMFRCIPTTRLKEFVESYMDANYPEERAISDFCHDAEINQRFFSTIRNLERPNISFDVVDRIFTKLECLHLWHLPPELGGFSDYYSPDIPPVPAEQTIIQRRTAFVGSSQKYARRMGIDWMDYLHGRALKEDAARAVPVAA